MKNLPLVSVIIPAYNVDKYIKKCVESALNQTYKNIEVIVINDGSKDSTENILLKINKIDSRLKVINKENAGVSAARNDGILAAKGEYITFIDGDDWVSSDFVEYMMTIVNKTNAELCLSTSCFTKKKEIDNIQDSISILNSDEAISLLLSLKVIVGCWNKIYKKDFLIKNSLLFDTNLFYGEGLSFIIMAANLSKKIGIGNKKKYYYRRDNQISATTNFNIEKIINGEKSLLNIKSKYINNEKSYKMWLLHMTTYYLGALLRVKANHLENQYAFECKKWEKYIKKMFQY